MSDLTNIELNEVTGGAAQRKGQIPAPKKEVKPAAKQPQKKAPTPAPKKNNQPKTPEILEDPKQPNKKR